MDDPAQPRQYHSERHRWGTKAQRMPFETIRRLGRSGAVAAPGVGVG